jgi:hypothetical protein
VARVRLVKTAQFCGASGFKQGNRLDRPFNASWAQSLNVGQAAAGLHLLLRTIFLNLKAQAMHAPISKYDKWHSAC